MKPRTGMSSDGKIYIYSVYIYIYTVCIYIYIYIYIYLPVVLFMLCYLPSFDLYILQRVTINLI